MMAIRRVETVRLTAAQAIVRYLQVQHSERDGRRRRLIPAMFGIFGHGNVAGLGQALEEYGDGLPYYQPANEQAMVHTASGFAKATRRLATLACTSSIGPGATNMVTGAATATINRLPVLLFPSDYYATRLQGEVLQQLEHPVCADVSVNDAFRPVSRFFDRITRPEQLLSALPEAMRVLTSPVETGAVTLALPQDLQVMAHDFPTGFFEERVWPVARPLPAPDSIEAGAAAIRAAHRPLILVGGGVHYADAGDALASFSTQLGIPIGETFGGKGAGAGAPDLLLGGLGVAGTPAAGAAAREADLVIGIGTRWGDFATGSRSAFQNPEVRFVSVNVASHDAYKMGAVPVMGDAKPALEGLQRACAGYRTSDRWRGRIAELKDAWEEQLRTDVYVQHPGEGMSQAQLIQVLNAACQPGDMVLAAAGSLPGDLLQLWDCSGDRGCLLEFGYSCMGWEVPAGIGAKLAHPDRQVHVLVGDGTYLMNNTELVTAVQEGIKIVVLIAVNRGYQVIRKLQMAATGIAFGNEFRARDRRTNRLEGAYLEIDYALNAESLGALGIRADSPESLGEALDQARAVEGRPVVIAVEVEPHRFAADSTVWWDIGVPETSERRAVRERRREYERQRAAQRLYG